MQHKTNPWRVNEAGRYAVALELLRLGIEAQIESNPLEFWSVVTPDSRIHVCAKSATSESWQTRTDYGRDPSLPALAHRQEFWVFVDLRHAGQPTEFYVVPATWMERDIFRTHQKFLEQHGGQRPRNIDSLHHSVDLGRVAQWRDRWELLQTAVAQKAG